MKMSKKKKNEQKIPKSITELDLKNTYFVPMKRMTEVMSFIDINLSKPTKDVVRCDYNLLNLKHERSDREFYDESMDRYASPRHTALFVSTCYKALYSHDWDRLLFILKSVPRWRFKVMFTFYVRMLSLLLMYHPESKKRGFFNEYLHMIWGCRSDIDKKAIQKVLFTLSKQMFRSRLLQVYCMANHEKRREAFAALAEKDNNNCED